MAVAPMSTARFASAVLMTPLRQPPSPSLRLNNPRPTRNYLSDASNRITLTTAAVAAKPLTFLLGPRTST